MKIIEGQKYIVRTDRAGVFYGEIVEKTHESITMQNVRKIWHWDGAVAVEGLARYGTTKPQNCNLTAKIELMEIESPIQVIPCTEEACNSLDGVKEWRI